MLFYMVVEAPPAKTKRTTPDIDESLIQKIGFGDTSAFEDFYNQTQQMVYPYILSILKNPEDTKDIMQDTYLKIRAAAHLYLPQGKPMAWVYTIARNLSLNHIKQSSRFSDNEEWFEGDSAYACVEDPTDRLVLESALQLLNVEERSILLLHAVSGVTHREISRDLGIPLSTALSRYHRALKKLRQHLQKVGLSNE